MAKEARSLQGKVVAITGGARGIGKATAKAMAGKGAKVAIGDLDKPLAEETAAQLGTEAVGLALDVTERDSFARFLDQVSERLGPLDVLINNAGIMPLGSFVDEDDATAQADDRHQRPRRHLRDEAGDSRDAKARQWPHRQHRLPGGQGRDSRGRHLLRDQARGRRLERGRARRAPRQRGRGVGGDARRGRHRAGQRATRHSRGEEARPRGGRRRDRQGGSSSPGSTSGSRRPAR